MTPGWVKLTVQANRDEHHFFPLLKSSRSLPRSYSLIAKAQEDPSFSWSLLTLSLLLTISLMLTFCACLPSWNQLLALLVPHSLWSFSVWNVLAQVSLSPHFCCSVYKSDHHHFPLSSLSLLYYSSSACIYSTKIDPHPKQVWILPLVNGRCFSRPLRCTSW